MTQALKRGLFGYRSRSVKAVLADREQMFDRASRDAKAAETRGDELATELETAVAKLATTLTDLEKALADLEKARTDLETAGAERDAARDELAERERSLEESTARATRAEAAAKDARAREEREGDRARRATTDLASAREDLAARNTRIREFELAIDRLEAERGRETEDEPAVASPGIVTSGDLHRVLQETENTIGRIVAETRRRAEHELEELERRRDDVRNEVEALLARRERLAPLAENVRELLGETQARTEEADSQLRTVLQPLAGSVASLSIRLAELMEEVEVEREDEPEIVTEEQTGATDDAPTTVIHLADEQAHRSFP